MRKRIAGDGVVLAIDRKGLIDVSEVATVSQKLTAEPYKRQMWALEETKELTLFSLLYWARFFLDKRLLGS